MDFDIIVVGGGHAGIEASLAAANLGFNVALITLDIKNIGQTPCNPAIGGPAKGVVVREIDALGGFMGIATDHNYLQMKMLNTSKGPGVQCLRAQIDKLTYPKYMQDTIMSNSHIKVYEDMATELIVEDKKIKGVLLEKSGNLSAKAVILTTGTYLDSSILVGFTIKKEGPDKQRSVYGMSDSLRKNGFNILRLKTGTPPRIKKSSIDYSEAEIQLGSLGEYAFSYTTNSFVPLTKQEPCYLIHTAKLTHQIIKDNIKKSAMYSGNIKGRGPRYCPSIEDKIVRFADKERHQLFLEPESANNDSIYLQGFSTSMPTDIQDLMIHSLPSMKNAYVYKYAYAIEYDAIYPTQVKRSLETKLVDGLFTAGQINGTSGYEEAAAQGLIAGVNACRKLSNKAPLILRRDEAYIGLMIDDLVTKGTNEPYRLLTSRSEFRLLLRHDNADIRLTEYGHEVGLINDDRYKAFLNKKANINNLVFDLKNSKASIYKNLESILENGENLNCTLYDLIKRPYIKLPEVLKIVNFEKKYNNDVVEETEIEIKYEGYIKKQQKDADELIKLENYIIPSGVNYNEVDHLALEARQKLNEVQPTTIGQASRISGVNPSDINVLMIHFKIK